MRWPVVLGCAMAALVSIASIEAQWVNYPTRGVPRLADGKPDLSAPAPRTADGKPDLSGIWQLEPDAPCPPGGCQIDYRPGRQFLNLGATLPGGLPYQPLTAAMVKERMERQGKDDPVGFCRPGGAVRILTFPPYRKILQMPDLVVILSERDVTYRQLFLDGRPLPTIRSRHPTATRPDDGRATRWSCRPTDCKRECGSIAAAARSARLRR